MADWFQSSTARMDSDYPPMQCFLCGEFVAVPTSSRMCATCLTKSVDLSENVSTHCTILQCSTCARFYHDRWLNCELESKELLSICLKKIKGIELLKIVEANFKWTEPHSKKLKIKLLAQKEVDNNCVVEQTLNIDFAIVSTQCSNCKQMYTPHTWKAMVQIRQKTKDKKHILLLEQIILKNNAHENVLNILSRRNGFDLHFPSRNDAQKFADFVTDKIVAQVKNSKKLVTQDVNNNKYNYKYTLHVSLVPICVDDLVFLSPKVCSVYGGVSPFLLCTNLTSTITLLDPFTLRRLEISSDKYWRHPFESRKSNERKSNNGVSVFNKFNLYEFIVLNIERDYSKKQESHYELVDVEIMASNSSKVIYTKSHLGKILTVGGSYLGYDIRRINMNGLSEEETNIKKKIPFDVILVRKAKKQSLKHNWVLKRIFRKKSNKEKDDLEDDIDEDELLDFKDEIISRKELQKDIDFYRNPRSQMPKEVDITPGSDLSDDMALSKLTVQLKELSINDDQYF